MTKIILASASSRRLALLKSMNIHPDEIISTDIDESPKPKEKPEQAAQRLAIEKAMAITKDGFIIAADTIAATKAKIFDKITDRETSEKLLQFYSGRRIKIHTGVAVIKRENGVITKKGSKLVSSTIKFKRFTPQEIQYYLDKNHGIGTAGGVNIQEFGDSLVQWFQGSYSGILGLPLYETVNLLSGMGYNVYPKS
jgi:septum formation protein